MSISPPYGQFSNVSIGAATIYFNSILVGFVEDAEVSYIETLKDLRLLIPQQLVGSVVQAVVMTAKAKLFEVNAENVSFVCGGLAITTNSASPVTTSAHTHIPLTANFLGTGLYGADLLGPTVSAATFTLADDSTAMTLTTDYFLNVATAGVANINPTGHGWIAISPSGTNFATIVSNGRVDGIWTYVPIASKQINFGASFPIIQQALDIIHSIPGTTGGSGLNGALVKKFHMDLARPNGRFDWKGNEKDWAFIDCAWESIVNSSNATAPLGYFLDESTAIA